MKTIAKSIIITLLISICQVAWADVEINEVNFPDVHFRYWLLRQPYGKDGILTDKEITEIKILDIPADLYIRSLSGIEHFTSMTDLICANNMLTLIDLSKNTALQHLNCCGNKLTMLDVSHNKELISIACFSNKLTSLDLSNNKKLKELWCMWNQIRGRAMDELVNSLPNVMRTDTQVEQTSFLIRYSSKNDHTDNVMTKDQVATARAKGWNPVCLGTNENYTVYLGE